MVVDSVSIPVRLGTIGENFSGIENVLRIEHSFDLAHYSEQLISELIWHKFSARDADTVLGGKRAFELAHQCGGLIGNLPKLFQVVCIVQIEHGTDVQKSTGRVTVITRLQPERCH